MEEPETPEEKIPDEENDFESDLDDLEFPEDIDLDSEDMESGDIL